MYFLNEWVSLVVDFSCVCGQPQCKQMVHCGGKNNSLTGVHQQSCIHIHSSLCTQTNHSYKQLLEITHSPTSSDSLPFAGHGKSGKLWKWRQGVEVISGHRDAFSPVFGWLSLF